MPAKILKDPPLQNTQAIKRNSLSMSERYDFLQQALYSFKHDCMNLCLKSSFLDVISFNRLCMHPRLSLMLRVLC